ncbi:hypothetical protein [Agromyces sp. NPDC058104]|uniref:hypothetical protein n=1 Tax=Agromyces sp. NPDC058104 TaxID=3346342 RepID=UPI0036DD1F7D
MIPALLWLALVLLALCGVGVALAVLGIALERRTARLHEEAAREVATFPTPIVLEPAVIEFEVTPVTLKEAA